MNARRLAALLLAVLLRPAAAGALQNKSGGNSGEFLDVGAGARALGMGEAFATVAEGPDAVYWNPAGLANARRLELSYTRAVFNRFFHHDFVAVSAPVRALRGALGASYTRLSQEKLTLVTNVNQEVGSFTPQSDAVSIAYATSFELDDDVKAERDYFGEAWKVPNAPRPLRARDEPWRGSLAVGLAVKAVNERIYRHNSHAVVFDGGALFRPTDYPDARLSFAFRNLGGAQKFAEESQNLPAELDFGIGWDRRSWRSRWLATLEAALPYFGNPYAKLGVEYSKPVGDGSSFAIRAGYKSMTAYDLTPLSGVTFGLGVRVSKATFDFGFQPVAELGQSFRFSFGFKW